MHTAHRKRLLEEQDTVFGCYYAVKWETRLSRVEGERRQDRDTHHLDTPGGRKHTIYTIGHRHTRTHSHAHTHTHTNSHAHTHRHTGTHA